MTHEPSFALSTTIDNMPRLHAELVLWAVCVTRNLPLSRFRATVNFVDEAPEDLASWLSERGIRVSIVERLVYGSPHCNRIASFLAAEEEDYIVATDSDLYFVGDPSLLFASRRIRACPNNSCNPPGYIFKKILEFSGLPVAYRPGVSLLPGRNGMRETHINNISAGIVALTSAGASEFARAWVHWAKWLVANRGLLADWAAHVDQVAFALACEQLESDVEFLPPQSNLILEMLPLVETAYALHVTGAHIGYFARRFNADRTLSKEGLQPGVIEAVERFNTCVVEAAREVSRLPSTRDHSSLLLGAR